MGLKSQGSEKEEKKKKKEGENKKEMKKEEMKKDYNQGIKPSRPAKATS